MSSPSLNGHIHEAERRTHTEEKDLPGGWVVLKFGGTSVGKFAENIAGIVQYVYTQNSWKFCIANWVYFIYL